MLASTAATDNRKYRYGPKTGNNYIPGILTDIVEIPAFRAGRGRMPQICRWNCHPGHPICHSSGAISISGFGATLPFPVVGHCRTHLATLYSGSP